jgi:hypothetical protein
MKHMLLDLIMFVKRTNDWTSTVMVLILGLLDLFRSLKYEQI